MGLFSKLKETENKIQLNKLKKKAKEIMDREQEMRLLSDGDLKEKTTEFKERFNQGESLDSLLAEAFAVVREVSDRVLGMRHYEVQLIGGMVLHNGDIAEMKTGEGKTLVATLPAYLNALTGKGVHIVTVNEYLAQRDHELMSPLFDFLGITSASVVGKMDKAAKREAYRSDVVYLTNTEVGFDYLRDNMVMSVDERVLRGLPFCIVDEVDSVLLDDARTPLIITGQGDTPSSWYHLADMFARTLKKQKDFTIDEETRSVFLTDEGHDKVESMFRLENYADANNGKIRFFIEKALNAHYVMVRNKDYIIQQNEIKIVDESTGRISEGRRFSNGLHQALEAKEGVRLQKENKTLATITYQNFFLLYDKLSGMTGTAKTNEVEFKDIYKLKVVTIPTNKKVKRKDMEDLLFVTEAAKNKAIVKDVFECHQMGQPVLIGTASIEKSERLSALLGKEGVPHSVLNAKNHKKEAEIIKNAGQKGSVTIATNMAGRGTDIKLGEGVRELGGLKVIGTERASNRRIDNQLIGRSGRQGDPGISQFYLSFDDDLLRIFSSEGVKKRIDLLANDDEPIEMKMLIRSIHSAQARIDGSQFEARKQTIEYDSINNEQRTIVYEQRNQLLDEEFDVVEELARLTAIHMTETHEQLRTRVEDVADGNEDDDTANQEYAQFLETIGLGSIPTDDELSKEQQTIIENQIESFVNETRKQLEEDPSVAEELRTRFIQTVDVVWREHLETLEMIKEEVKFAGFKQENPIDEYAKESHRAFSEAMEQIKQTMIHHFLHSVPEKEPASIA